MAQEPSFDQLVTDGAAALDRGDYSAARDLLERAHDERPADAHARFWLAAAQYHLGNVADARRHLDAVLAANAVPVPERPAAVFEYLCRCHLAADTRRATVYGEDGVRCDPHDPRLRLVLGFAYFRLGELEKALSHYDGGSAAERRDGRAAFPGEPGRLPFARTTVLVALRRWDEALGAIDEALAREPHSAAYHNRRAEVLFDGLGDAEGAMEAARRAVELNPGAIAAGGDGSAFYNLARYLRHLGHGDRALAAIERAIAIRPEVQYKKLREELRGTPPTSA